MIVGVIMNDIVGWSTTAKKMMKINKLWLFNVRLMMNASNDKDDEHLWCWYDDVIKVGW